VDAAVAPSGVVGGHAQDQATQASWDGRPTGPGVLARPAVGDELAVPAQDRGRGNQQAQAASRREQTRESGDDSSVVPAHPRPCGAALQHRKLVTEDQDLDLLCGIGSSAQQRPVQ
jgi:hypothetical protein